MQGHKMSRVGNFIIEMVLYAWFLFSERYVSQRQSQDLGQHDKMAPTNNRNCQHNKKKQNNMQQT